MLRIVVAKTGGDSLYMKVRGTQCVKNRQGVIYSGIRINDNVFSFINPLLFILYAYNKIMATMFVNMIATNFCDF